jgi:hypothetical protein
MFKLYWLYFLSTVPCLPPHREREVGHRGEKAVRPMLHIARWIIYTDRFELGARGYLIDGAFCLIKPATTRANIRNFKQTVILSQT